MWNLKYNTKKHIYDTETDLQTENRLVVAKGVRGRKDWKLGISRCKLLHIGWINRVLCYSTGTYVQYLVTNHNGNEYEKNIYVYN